MSATPAPGRRTLPNVLFAVVALAAAVSQSSMARAQAITEQDAHDIGVNAYLYFYPLVSMDVTRRQSTNVEPGKEMLKGPMNTFSNASAYPPGDLKLVVRINFDTLYSFGWLDLTKEPVVVSSPDTNGRYFLLPMLDMWTDVFASPGWRTTGTQAQNSLIIPPGWRPDLRERLVEEFKLPTDIQVIDAPTPYVLIAGRTKTDGPQDYDAVHKIQAGYKITPLSQWGKTPEPVTAKIDPTVDMKTPPKQQVEAMAVAAHGATTLNSTYTSGALHFLAQSKEREIDTLKSLLGFAESKPRFEVDDDSEAS